jgi:hypothetical protein
MLIPTLLVAAALVVRTSSDETLIQPSRLTSISTVGTTSLTSEQQVVPHSATVVPSEPAPADAGEQAYRSLVAAAWSLNLEALPRHADRLMNEGSPEQQFVGFFLVLRSEAWLHGVMSEGTKLDCALEMLDRAMAVRSRADSRDGAHEYTNQAFDQHVALLDEAISNAFLAVQRARSGIHRPAIDRAFASLRSARPWWWFNDRAEEIASERSLIGAYRDQLLVDLCTESLLSQFREELTSDNRTNLAIVAGTLSEEGEDITERRGAVRKFGDGQGRLIPQYARVFDASNASILDPITPRNASARLAFLD